MTDAYNKLQEQSSAARGQLLNVNAELAALLETTTEKPDAWDDFEPEIHRLELRRSALEARIASLDQALDIAAEKREIQQQGDRAQQVAAMAEATRKAAAQRIVLAKRLEQHAAKFAETYDELKALDETVHELAMQVVRFAPGGNQWFSARAAAQPRFVQISSAIAEQHAQSVEPVKELEASGQVLDRALNEALVRAGFAPAFGEAA
jgi:chromosome segregation ATPase